MRPTNPLYYILPDHYALRRWFCNIFGHKFVTHHRVVDYTLDEVHHVRCATCYGVRKESTMCYAESDAVVHDIKTKGRVHA